LEPGRAAEQPVDNCAWGRHPRQRAWAVKRGQRVAAFTAKHIGRKLEAEKG